MIVVDASVAAKWLLPETGTEAALALQEGPDELFAPGLIRVEVAGAITRRVRAENDRLSQEDAIERCERWFRLLEQSVLSLIPEHDLLAEAVTLSVQIKHSLHDCLYLAAANRLGARLVTADRALFEKSVGVFKKIAMLPGCERN